MRNNSRIRNVREGGCESYITYTLGVRKRISNVEYILLPDEAEWRSGLDVWLAESSDFP